MRYRLLFHVVLVVVSIAHVCECYMFERRFVGYYRNATLCGSLLAYSSNFSDTQVPKIRALSQGINELELLCLNGGLIILTEASYGAKNAAKCPKPSSVVVEASDRYCASLRNFFTRLQKNCSLSEEFVRTNVSVRYGDLGDAETCRSEKPNLRLSFEGGFCKSELDFYAQAARRFQGVSEECLHAEFFAVFAGCKKSSVRSSQLWVETRTTRNTVNAKCASKPRCKLNIDRDFPARFAFKSYSSQSLFINYRCNAVRHKFRPSFDKRAKLGKMTLWWRLKRPPSSKIELKPAAHGR